MEKIAQQFGTQDVETCKELSSPFACDALQQPQILSLDLLDLVGGGDGEIEGMPTKGW